MSFSTVLRLSQRSPHDQPNERLGSSTLDKATFRDLDYQRHLPTAVCITLIRSIIWSTTMCLSPDSRAGDQSTENIRQCPTVSTEPHKHPEARRFRGSRCKRGKPQSLCVSKVFFLVCPLQLPLMAWHVPGTNNSQ